jgi:SAM-dependent methyltransferase
MWNKIRNKLRRIYWKTGLVNRKFPGSGDYWGSLYKAGGNSGPGSYNRLAQFKAGIINWFIDKEHIHYLVDLGCGDGNQLDYLQVAAYTGFDISAEAVEMCRIKFKEDRTKDFFQYQPQTFKEIAWKKGKPGCAVSLDVIYHLTEDRVFEQYMQDLFSVSGKFVIIYSSNYNGRQVFHERHHRFTDWINKYKKEWQLLQHISNPFPFDKKDPDNTSESDFYIFQYIA